MADKMIYVKLLKPWGGWVEGDVIRFGESKGRSRIELGIGVEVSKQKAVNDIQAEELEAAKRKAEKPKVETATLKPDAETAEVTPQKIQKPVEEKPVEDKKNKDKKSKTKDKGKK